MLKLTDIEEITMRYIFKDETDCYEYIQDNQFPTSLANNQTIKFRLKPKLGTVNESPFDMIITYKDNRYWVKSDFFDEVSKLYPLNLFLGEDEAILMAEFPKEKQVMYLHIIQKEQ